MYYAIVRDIGVTETWELAPVRVLRKFKNNGGHTLLQVETLDTRVSFFIENHELYEEEIEEYA